MKGLSPIWKRRSMRRRFLRRVSAPFKAFMLKNTREKDLALFVKLRGEPRPATPEDVSLLTLIPAFMISELKTAFQIGFLLYIPFLVIDLVVSTVLISMGILMLPPMMLSLPLKLLLFVLVDGWNLLIFSLVKSFH
jgi:flagellar biosynthetic protein FliP